MFYFGALIVLEVCKTNRKLSKVQSSLSFNFKEDEMDVTWNLTVASVCFFIPIYITFVKCKNYSVGPLSVPILLLIRRVVLFSEARQTTKQLNMAPTQQSHPLFI